MALCERAFRMRSSRPAIRNLASFGAAARTLAVPAMV